MKRWLLARSLGCACPLIPANLADGILPTQLAAIQHGHLPPGHGHAGAGKALFGQTPQPNPPYPKPTPTTAAV